jgi:hypothetical protein
MLLYLVLRSGLWRSLDGEKLRFFLGFSPRDTLSRQRPLWRAVPWGRALFSARGGREVFEWLRYRVELYDGKAG